MILKKETFGRFNMKKKLAALTAVAVLGVPVLGGCFGGDDYKDCTGCY